MWNIEFSCKGNKDPSTGIHRKHLYIAHAQKPLITLMLEKPENRVDPNQLITDAKIC